MMFCLPSITVGSGKSYISQPVAELERQVDLVHQAYALLDAESQVQTLLQTPFSSCKILKHLVVSPTNRKLKRTCLG